MKAVFVRVAVFGCLIGLLGCAAEDGPTAEEVQEQFRRGISGQGQLTPGTDRGGEVKPRIGEADVTQ